MNKEIILVGTYHFEQDQEIIEQKEKEIEELVDHLADYKPTKVALEWDLAEENELNEAYQRSNGNYSIDELEQVGFRLAKRLKLEKLHAVNWSGRISQDDVSNLHTAIQNSYPDLLKFMDKLSENAPVISMNNSLIDSYKKLNDEESIKELEQMYLSFVNVTDSTGGNIGFDFLNKWMERELMIFQNILEKSKSEDRMLLVIGSDHLWMLKNLFEGHGWSVINPFKA